MDTFDKKKYLLDGAPVSASELIDEASYIDSNFDSNWLKSTSAAARILRNNGQTVEYNKEEYQEEER